MTYNLETYQNEGERELLSYLVDSGYEVTRGAKLKGKSSIEHTFDILAKIEDEIICSLMAIRFVESHIKEKQAYIIFNFANKAYDTGIKERIIITDKDFNETSLQIASKWHIKIFNTAQAKAIIAAKQSKNRGFFKNQEPLKYGNTQELISSLINRGYQAEENTKIVGGSGILYKFDILAMVGIGFWDYKVGIDFLNQNTEVSLEQVSVFDTKCYDTGILAKVIIANPKLGSNAKLFAKHQGIKFLEQTKSNGDNSHNNEVEQISKFVKTEPKILAEIESNLKIAVNEKIDASALFQTDLWDKNQSETDNLPLNVLSETEEAYGNIRLANNLLWLITEIGDSSGKLSAEYHRLCQDIARRLGNYRDHINKFNSR